MLLLLLLLIPTAGAGRDAVVAKSGIPGMQVIKIKEGYLFRNGVPQEGKGKKWHPGFLGQFPPGVEIRLELVRRIVIHPVDFNQESY